MKRFLNAYGSVNLCSAASECFIPHLLNGIATFGGLAFADVEKSRCIIIWGSNPFASGSMVGCSMPRTMKIFKELKEKDIPLIAKRALDEAHPDYPVPTIMTLQECEDLIRKLLPK